MSEFFNIEDHSDEDKRYLREIAEGLGKSVDDAAEQMIGLIMENRKAIRQALVAADVADMALHRAKKRSEKVPD